MPPLNSYDDHSQWADNSITISQLDRVLCSFIVIYIENNSRGTNVL